MTNTRAQKAQRLIRKALNFDLSAPTNDSIKVRTSQHPGVLAQTLVRDALAPYHIPQGLETRYLGMRRLSGTGAHDISSGVLFVEASMRNRSGVKRTIEIPIQVKDGYLLHPEVFKSPSGEMHVIAQSSLDAVMHEAELPSGAQLRSRHMYAQLGTRPLRPGTVAHCTTDVTIRTRGGAAFKYPKGEKVIIIRDLSGDGTTYYCEFPDRRRAPVHYTHIS